MPLLDEVCAYLRNYFDDGQPHTFGEIEIKNGALFTPCDLKAGQYFRIVGSTFNDGVYEFPTTTLRVDETFNGAVWGMAVPPDLISKHGKRSTPIRTRKTELSTSPLLRPNHSAAIRIARGAAVRPQTQAQLLRLVAQRGSEYSAADCKDGGGCNVVAR